MAYIYTEKTIKMPLHDADIMLVLPNKSSVVLQWRVGEGVSLDVCLSEETPVTIWTDDNMTPAKKLDTSGSTLTKQMVLSFDDSVLVKD